MLIRNYNSVVQKVLIALSLFMSVGLLSSTAFATEAPMLHYTFESSTVENDTIVKDQSGNGYDGILHNEAYINYDAELGMGILDLGTYDGYLDMQAATGVLVSDLEDFTISTFVYVGENNQIASWGNMLYTFSNSDDQGANSNGYLFMSLTTQASRQVAYRITTTGGGGEAIVNSGVSSIPVGSWHHLTVSQSGSTSTFYYDGVEAGSVENALTPSDLGATIYNFIGKPCYSADVYMVDTKVADFRVYDRAISPAEALVLAGPTGPDDYPASLLTERDALDLGDLSGVTSAIALPTTGASDTEVLITWESSNRLYIDTVGNVTQPEDLDVNVKLTATLSKNGYSIKKEFTATVLASNGFTDVVVLNWLFDPEFVDPETGVVTDQAEKNFEGVMMNGAKTRKIGTSASGEFYTLDLGDQNGYFDMGADVGTIVTALSDYMISVYFLIEEDNTTQGQNGNFLYNFSNSDDVATDQNGIMFGGLNNFDHHIGPKYWNSENQSVSGGTAATKGTWHHWAFTQQGNEAKIYLDCQLVGSGSISNLPSTSLVLNGRTGTYYNFLGRAGYASDAYLENTLIYDFQLYNVGASEDDVYDLFFDNLEALNAAYLANPDPEYPAELLTQRDALDLGDISALESDIVLPEVLDDDVMVEWSTSNANLIDVFGTVTRPDNIDVSVLLTAKLSKNGYSVTKEFTATVLATSGFTSSLILKYDFTDADTVAKTVTDQAEKHYVGTLENGASIRTIGEGGNQFDVLDLGGDTDSCYFDMGEDVGELIYALADYSISLYFYVDTLGSDALFQNNGNFLYTFSNGDSSNVQQNGYMFGRATNLVHVVASGYWDSGSVGTPSVDNPSKGNWHHMVYTQNGSTGTVYFNGDTLNSQEFANIPAVALVKEGMTGTPFNWLGRSCYAEDEYLHNALMYDFRLYNEAISPEDISTLSTVVEDLNDAYSTGVPTSVSISEEVFVSIDSSVAGEITINGSAEEALVSVYDISGREVALTTDKTILLNAGIYIVKVDNSVEKVIVK